MALWKYALVPLLNLWYTTLFLFCGATGKVGNVPRDTFDIEDSRAYFLKKPATNIAPSAVIILFWSLQIPSKNKMDVRACVPGASASYIRWSRSPWQKSRYNWLGSGPKNKFVRTAARGLAVSSRRRQYTGSKNRNTKVSTGVAKRLRTSGGTLITARCHFGAPYKLVCNFWGVNRVMESSFHVTLNVHYVWYVLHDNVHDNVRDNVHQEVHALYI